MRHTNFRIFTRILDIPGSTIARSVGAGPILPREFFAFRLPFSLANVRPQRPPISQSPHRFSSSPEGVPQPLLLVPHFFSFGLTSIRLPASASNRIILFAFSITLSGSPMATSILSRKKGVIVGDDVLNLFKYAQEKKFAIPAIVCQRSISVYI